MSEKAATESWLEPSRATTEMEAAWIEFWRM